MTSRRTPGPTTATTPPSLWPGSATSWRHLAGPSYVAFALVWPATPAPAVVAGTALRQELLLFVVTTVGALSLSFYGVDVARGGRHLSVTSDVERVLGE